MQIRRSLFSKARHAAPNLSQASATDLFGFSQGVLGAGRILMNPPSCPGKE
jgi:hypothetical protein